jgi:hypothetical protein
MQYNELYIKVDGVYYKADILSNEVPINIQSFNVDDLANRFIDYSQSLLLPTNDNNNKIFKHANEFTTYSDIQDMELPCIFLVSGISVFGIGSYIKVISISSTTYECQMVGSAKEFLNSIKAKNDSGKEKNLNDLSFDATILRSYNSFVDYATAKTQDLFYAICDFDKTDLGTDTSVFAAKYLVADNQKPFIWYKSILEKILEDNGGYELITDVDTDDIDNMALPLASINENLDYTQLLDTASGATPVLIYAEASVVKAFLFVLFNSDPILPNFIRMESENSKFSADGNSLLSYTAEKNGSHVFDIDIDTYITQQQLLYSQPKNTTYYLKKTFAVFINGEEAPDYRTDIVFTSNYQKQRLLYSRMIIRKPISIQLEIGDVVTFVYTVDLVGEDVLGFFQGGYVYDAVQSFNISLINIVPKVGIVEMGIDVSARNNLPEITQWNFFKAFLQKFCLVFTVDNRDKKIYCYNFRRILDNKTIAVDWSDKLVKYSGVIDNTPPYAKKNIIKYKDTSRDAEEQGLVVLQETQAEDIFNRGIVIYYAETEGDYTAIPQVLQYVTVYNDTFPSGMYKYLTLPGVIENDDLTITDEGFISCNNPGLEEEKTIITLPFESVEFYRSSDKNGDEFNYAKFRDCEEKILTSYKEPRLVTIEGDYVFDIKSSEGADRTDISLPVASPINQRSVQAQALVDKYYFSFEDTVLRDYRKIESAFFDLDENDIETFSPYIPVYIEKFGAYFHVNIISNYMKNKLTEVELIKI